VSGKEDRPGEKWVQKPGTVVITGEQPTEEQHGVDYPETSNVETEELFVFENDEVMEANSNAEKRSNIDEPRPHREGKGQKEPQGCADKCNYDGNHKVDFKGPRDFGLFIDIMN